MWQEFLSSLFPKRCVNCETIIPHFQEYLCESCKYKLPFTGIDFNKNTLMHKKIEGIEYASSLLFFNKNNIAQKLMHFLKYKDLPEIGCWLADIWLEQNKDNPLLIEIESVIPLPIHPKRLKRRNYNQVFLCAQRISEYLNCTLDDTTLSRIQHLKSQTNANRGERLSRMTNAFERTTKKTGHFLVVDDVLTTGATLTSCTQKLLKEPGTEVSVFTLAMVP